MKKREHKYAQVLRWLADGEKIQGRRTNEPMDWKNFPEEFSSTFNHALIHEAIDNMEFRILPRTIRVNGVEVPAPERVAPAYGITYYIPDPTLEDYYCESAWVDGLADIRELERGLVYLTKEDAISRAKAMLLTQE